MDCSNLDKMYVCFLHWIGKLRQRFQAFFSFKVNTWWSSLDTKKNFAEGFLDTVSLLQTQLVGSVLSQEWSGYDNDNVCQPRISRDYGVPVCCWVSAWTTLLCMRRTWWCVCWTKWERWSQTCSTSCWALCCNMYSSTKRSVALNASTGNIHVESL